MRRRLPWLAAALAALYLVAGLKSPKRAGLDLESFGRVPVLHNGRIKPLDTVARNSLLMILGKQTLREEDPSGRRVPAVEWLLELSASPERADARKAFLIHDPDLLGLMGRREEDGTRHAFKDLEPFLMEISRQARAAGEIDAKRRSRFQAAAVNLHQRIELYQRLKHSLRLPDTEDYRRELAEYRIAVAEGKEAFSAHVKAGGDFGGRELNRLGVFFRRYRFMAEASPYRPVPPAEGEPDDAWTTLGESLMLAMRDGEVRPEAESLAMLTEHYRRGETEAFNRLLTRHLAASRLERPSAAASARREAVFNRAEPFFRGMVVYVAVFLLVCLSWLADPKAFRTAAYYVLIAAFSAHTLGLLARMALQGRPPVTNLYSSAVFVGWAAVLLAIVLERLYRSGIGSLAASAVGFGTLLVAHHLAAGGDTLEMMQAVLDSNFWLATHVVTITIGYSSTFLAGLLATVYILRRLLGVENEATEKSLAQMTYGIVCFSLLLSFIGTVLGGIWADQSWGRFWGWDPKENGAFMIVLWHAMILHARWGGYIRRRGLMVMAVFGNVVTALSWFGVNMLGIGLHSYGFMDKAFWWLSGYCASQLVLMGLAFLPPRPRRRTAAAEA